MEATHHLLSGVCLRVRSATQIGCWKLICMTLLLSVLGNANAANWYIDSSVASSGNGQSWATAWKGTGNIAGVQPGDTVFFSGGTSGKSYAASNWTPTRGTSGNPVSYRVGQEAGHSGMVTFTGTGNFLSGNLSDITINGEVSGQQRMTIDRGNSFVIYSDGQDTHRFKFLYIIFTGGIWCRSDYVEIAYCNGTSPLSITDDSMIAHIGDRGASGWGVNKIHHNYFKCWRKKIRGEGFDCLKWCGSVDVYDNQFISVYHPSYTGTQHGDGWQGNGEYVRIYNNYFENWISYPILNEMYGNCAHWRIFNNVFYAEESGVDWTAYWAIAIGFNPGALGTVSDFIIANNTMIGGPNRRGIGFNYSPIGTVGADCYVVNNIVYNSDNVVGSNGNVIKSNNVGGSTGLAFVTNAAYPNGDFRLTSGATAAIDKGISPSYLTAVFTTDKDGKQRTGTWDVGAFEFGAGGGGGTPTPFASLTPSALNFGSVLSGTTKDLTVSVQNTGTGTLTGSATTSAPFSILSGGSYSLAGGQSQTVTIRYSPTTAGTNNGSVSFSGANQASASLTGVSQTVLPGLSFESTAGTLSSPFVANAGGYISQASDTSLADGGSAVYLFNVAAAGEYTVSVMVNASTDAANSMFINIDADPVDPTMVWDVMPLTNGLESRQVSWRGTGAFDSPQFPQKVFSLTAGTHRLIIRGREGATQIGKITVAPSATRPSPPSGLRVVPGP